MRFIAPLAAVLAALGANAHKHAKDYAAQVREHLTPRLSEDATITFPGEPEWDELNIRAASPRVNPHYVAVVEVATEADVQETIKAANKLKLPFLAVAGGHGWTNTVSNVKNGIQINLRRLNTASVNADGKSATVGGGTLVHELVTALYAEGKQATHGTCECISIAGPLLGGGHGLLQNKNGFSADHLLSARVVLADGRAVTASPTENEDLFWALRGAGHNFGIVTSFEVDVYDQWLDGWNIITWVFTQDKLEEYFETWNRLEEEIDDVGLLVMNGHYLRIPTFDPDQSIIDLQMMYHESSPAAETYIAAFRAIEALDEKIDANLGWKDVFSAGLLSMDDPLCDPNTNVYAFPSSVDVWDPTAMRRGYELFTELVEADNGKYAGGTAFIFQSSGRKGPSNYPYDFNAMPHEERDYHILMAIGIRWAGDNEQDTITAGDYGLAMRDATRSNVTKPHAYVNYAVGFEPLEEIYGWNTDRLTKLKTLKKKWDPKNRFGFYLPIA